MLNVANHFGVQPFIKVDGYIPYYLSFSKKGTTFSQDANVTVSSLMNKTHWSYSA